jgi:hypothetical protein
VIGLFYLLSDSISPSHLVHPSLPLSFLFSTSWSLLRFLIILLYTQCVELSPNIVHIQRHRIPRSDGLPPSASRYRSELHRVPHQDDSLRRDVGYIPGLYAAPSDQQKSEFANKNPPAFGLTVSSIVIPKWVSYHSEKVRLVHPPQAPTKIMNL